MQFFDPRQVQKKLFRSLLEFVEAKMAISAMANLLNEVVAYVISVECTQVYT